MLWDFSDPRLAGAALASVTALTIAFVAYPIQKWLDRRLQKEQERRGIYRDFWEATNRHFSMVHHVLVAKDTDGLTESHVDLVAKAAGIVLYARVKKRQNTLEACRSYYQRLLEYETYAKANCGHEPSKRFIKKNADRYSGNPYEKVKVERRKALLALRRDLGDSARKADQAATSYFVYTPREELE